MVTSLLIEAAEKTPGIYSEIKPYVFQISLNEINVTCLPPVDINFIHLFIGEGTFSNELFHLGLVPSPPFHLAASEI